MSARRLHIAKSFWLPIDAVTETFWFSGKRGGGKTHNCTVLVEEMLKARTQVVILDSMRAWYGLRSSVDGKHAGIPILICGGPHGDMPLNPLAGTLMAEFAVREGVSMILDMKEWSKGQRERFVKDFLLRLLQINEEAMHVVFEEAPRFAPQNPDKGIAASEMLGAVIDFVQTGRGSGLGGSFISQRSANLNSNVRSQTSVLVAHKANYKLDIDAMNDWFVYHESPLAATVKTRLPHLPVGTAIMASIELFGDEDSLREVTFRPRETFDSSSTPKVGERKRVAKTFAEIDISSISAEMTAMVEEANANDPATLKNEIAALRKRILELEARPSQVEHSIETKEFETEVIPEFVRKQVRAVGDHVLHVKTRVANLVESLQVDMGEVHDALDEIEQGIEKWTPKRTEAGTTKRTEQAPSRAEGQAKVYAREDTVHTARVDTSKLRLTSTPEGIKIGRCERAILTVLAQIGPRDQRKVAIFAGYQDNKAFSNSASACRSQGLLVGGRDMLTITDLGREVMAGQYEVLPTGDALYQKWMADRRIGKCERTILRILHDAYPERLNSQEIADRTDGEYEANKAFENSISKLRGYELIEGTNREGGMFIREELMGA